MKTLRYAFLFAAILSVGCWAQTAEKGNTDSDNVAITLSMDWNRGDSHYGDNFIRLSSTCAERVGHTCTCVADFKAISSKQNSKDFADHVTSFPHGKVPVVYVVSYSKTGRFLGSRLLRVGDWTADRFDGTDGLLGVKTSFKPQGNGKLSEHVDSPADCFGSHAP